MNNVNNESVIEKTIASVKKKNFSDKKKNADYNGSNSNDTVIKVKSVVPRRR